MQDSLEQLIFKRFGHIVDPSGYPACGDGWFNILWALLTTIEDMLKHDQSRNEYLQKEIELATHKQAPYENLSACEIEEKVAKWTAQLNPPLDFKVVQIKEKFGTLRFYCAQTSSDIDGAIYMAETLSEQTCEVCGRPGILRNGSWLKVLCDEHEKTREVTARATASEGKHISVVMNNKSAIFEIIEVISDTKVVVKYAPFRSEDPTIPTGPMEATLVNVPGITSQWILTEAVSA